MIWTFTTSMMHIPVIRCAAREHKCRRHMEAEFGKHKQRLYYYLRAQNSLKFQKRRNNNLKNRGVKQGEVTRQRIMLWPRTKGRHDYINALLIEDCRGGWPKGRAELSCSSGALSKDWERTHGWPSQLMDGEAQGSSRTGTVMSDGPGTCGLDSGTTISGMGKTVSRIASWYTGNCFLGGWLQGTKWRNRCGPGVDWARWKESMCGGGYMDLNFWVR